MEGTHWFGTLALIADQGTINSAPLTFQFAKVSKPPQWAIANLQFSPMLEAHELVTPMQQQWSIFLHWMQSTTPCPLEHLDTKSVRTSWQKIPHKE